jgi:hypothetical protein
VGPFSELMQRLVAAQVEFVIIGGMAAVLHGSTQVTYDLDICAPFNEENMARILTALQGLEPCHRLSLRKPVKQTAAELSTWQNLYLDTKAGVLDVLGNVEGLGRFADLIGRTTTVVVFNLTVSVLDLDSLIAAKGAMNRPRDRRVIAELETKRRKP